MVRVSIKDDSIFGKHIILNTNCSIDHECSISDFVHISPNAVIAGNVTVNEGANIGIGSTIFQGVKIWKWDVVAAGCVIIKDVPYYVSVVENPKQIFKI